MTKEEIIKTLTHHETANVDHQELLKNYPEPVSRYLRYHLPEGIPGATHSVTPMKGIIKLVNWAQFKSVLYANPFRGFLWTATVKMGILPVKGFDYFLVNKGAMQWSLFNFIPVNKADGPDVTRSAEGRAMLEALFTPHLLIHPEVEWKVISENEITVNWNLFQENKPVHLIIGDDGALKQAFAQRWGNPGDSKTWEYHNFGVNVEKEIKRKGILIPAKGNAGWWFNQKEYDDGEFFRFEVG
jgi:hypothetical protein